MALAMCRQWAPELRIASPKMLPEKQEAIGCAEASSPHTFCTGLASRLAARASATHHRRPLGNGKWQKMVSVILVIHKYIWLVLRHSGNTEFRKAVIT